MKNNFIYYISTAGLYCNYPRAEVGGAAAGERELFPAGKNKIKMIPRCSLMLTILCVDPEQAFTD